MSEIIANRKTLLAMQLLTLELKLDVLIQELERRYDPDQPRVPAGRSGGGQWTSQGAIAPHGASFTEIVATARELRLSAINPNDRFRCNELCLPLLERPSPGPGSDKNYWAFQKCLNECLGKNI